LYGKSRFRALHK